MSSYKFGKVTVSSKQFYEAIEIDIKTLNIDHIVVSDPITDDKNGGKRYIIGYNIDGKIVALRIKTPKNVYSYGVSKYTDTSKLCMSFNLEGHDEWIEKYKKNIGSCRSAAISISHNRGSKQRYIYQP